jgi:atrial natriuretic peptide clearance receptor, putative (fragment)
MSFFKLKFVQILLIVILFALKVKLSEVHSYTPKRFNEPTSSYDFKYTKEAITRRDPKNYDSKSTSFTAHLFGLFTLDSDLGINPLLLKATLILATEEANNRFPNIQFLLKLHNSSNSCLNHNIGAHAAEEFYLRKVTAFIGPACSLALNAVARMAAYWNVPILTAGGISEDFRNKKVFASLMRLFFSSGKLC